MNLIVSGLILFLSLTHFNLCSQVLSPDSNRTKTPATTYGKNYSYKRSTKTGRTIRKTFAITGITLGSLGIVLGTTGTAFFGYSTIKSYNNNKGDMSYVAFALVTILCGLVAAGSIPPFIDAYQELKPISLMDSDCKGEIYKVALNFEF